jgi:hypothetical protein
LSGGAVSALIARWKQHVGIEYADQLRELAIALKKGGFSALQLAGAVRLKNIMDQIGVPEESLREFLTETYEACKGIGLQPYQIATYLGDLVAFSFMNSGGVRKIEISSSRTENLEGKIQEDEYEAKEEKAEEMEGEEEEEGEDEKDRYFTKVVPLFSQLPVYMANLKNEKIRLEGDIRKLRKSKNLTKNQCVSIMQNKDKMLKECNMAEEQLRWYEKARTELKKYDLSVDDIPEFVKSVRWIQDAGYAAAAIVSKFSNYADLQMACQDLELGILQIEKKKEELEQSITYLKESAPKIPP